MWLILILSTALAQVPEAPQSLFNLPSKNEKRPIHEDRVPGAVRRKPIGSSSSGHSTNTGYKREFSPRPQVAFIAENPSVTVKIMPNKFKGLIRSSVVKARINDSIIAYEGSKDPVRATITEGEYRGAVLFGSATMDKTTKAAIVAFDTFIPPNSEKTYKFLATIKDQNGVSGLKGILESDYWTYFFTQLALDTTAAAADATTEKTMNYSGAYNPVPGPDSTIKQGFAGGLSKTADRIAERNNQIPEFVTVHGPVYVRVYIMEQPEEN